ncbi:MAG: hydroxyacylglutathione hydrolase [Bdellovibrionota bacterium]
MLSVKILPALQDNYIAVIVCESKNLFWCIDPGDTAAIARFLEAHPTLHCGGVFCTHHHADHVDAVPLLVERFGCTVWGPDHARMKGVATAVIPREITIPLAGYELSPQAAPLHALLTPGHTVPALSYVLETFDKRYLFSGDTLFGAGCGRLFEGSPEQMWSSLQKLRALPDDTLLICGHEYTQTNLSFAEGLGWRSEIITLELERVLALRKRDEPTLPRTIALEKETNPFLNADDPELAAALELAPDTLPGEVFRILRLKRNSF